ncbi:hypothetical protein POM88_045288 [Heracleum sosnowskyi]|uniref:Uncharacterized protein n=1 Tax=Heracleum sosnowskyi TaxID=360622 RepID=A0AAD8M5X6_9APIA|nr:hypothetical protein POM88_045288 [Heracleum sosnowskyi]
MPTLWRGLKKIEIHTWVIFIFHFCLYRDLMGGTNGNNMQDGPVLQKNKVVLYIRFQYFMPSLYDWVVNRVLGLPKGRKEIKLKPSEKINLAWANQFKPATPGHVSPWMIFYKIKSGNSHFSYIYMLIGLLAS